MVRPSPEVRYTAQMRRLLAVALICHACADPGAASRAPEPPSSPPCPDQEALIALARTAAPGPEGWELASEAATVRCAVLRIPQARWLVAASLPYWTGERDERIHEPIDVVVLIDPVTRKPLAEVSPELRGNYQSNLALTPVDFEGDGVEEALVASGSLVELAVVHEVDGRLELSRPVPIGAARDGPRGEPLVARYEVIPGAGKTRQIAVTVSKAPDQPSGGLLRSSGIDVASGLSGDPPPPPMQPGRHILTWNGTTLAPVNGAGR